MYCYFAVISALFWTTPTVFSNATLTRNLTEWRNLRGHNSNAAPGCGSINHGGIRYGALSSQRSHSNAYAVLSPLAATLLMAQTQSIIVTYTGFHAFGTWEVINKMAMTASSNADRRRSVVPSSEGAKCITRHGASFNKHVNTMYIYISVLPRFSKGQGAIWKGHFSPVNGPSKGHFSTVNGQSKGHFSAVNWRKRA